MGEMKGGLNWVISCITNVYELLKEKKNPLNINASR